MYPAEGLPLNAAVWPLGAVKSIDNVGAHPIAWQHYNQNTILMIVEKLPQKHSKQNLQVYSTSIYVYQ